MANIHLGLIGCGNIAGAHAAAADGSGRVSISAVVDPLAGLREAMAARTGAAGFDTLESLLAARDAGAVRVDAVVVCTRPSVRLPLVRAALEAGLGVLAEKPLAHRSDDAAALVALADQHPECATAVAYCHRFTPAHVRMRDLIAAGKIGRPIRFENTFACWHPTMQAKWMSDAAVAGGGSFIDTGCHSLDLFGFFFGGVDRVNVEAAMLNHGWAGRAETHATVLCSAVIDSQEPSNGHGAPRVAGVIASGWAEPDRFTVAVVGTAGTLSYDFIAAPEVVRFAPSQGSPEDLPVTTHEVRFQRQLEAFADHLADPASPTPLASFAQGAAVAGLVDQAYGRSRAARRVATAV